MAPRDRNRHHQIDAHRVAAWQGPVTLRLADATDLPALEQLARLDSRPLLPGPHLVAEREGRIDAARSLSTGGVVADPFRRTAELCALLRCHAGDVRAAPRLSRSLHSQLRPLPVPA